MTGNSERNRFYILKYMMDDYHKASDTYVVAEIEAGELLMDMVISANEPDIDSLARTFVSEMDQNDRTLHVKGTGFADFEESKLMFPLLAHV